jgi:uncharacterized membrane protein (DUF106 family)
LEVTGFFTLILRPFENGYGTAGIVFISILTGAVMLFLFKLTSNQEAMKVVKTKISAYFLEMRLYKEDISAVVGSQKSILVANMQYMKLALIPAAVMIVPVILIMIQLNLRYSQAGLQPGDTALVKVKVEEEVDVIREGITLNVGSGLEKASPAVRIPSLGEADWKIRLTEAGIHDLTLKSASGDVVLPVFGNEKLVPVFSIFKKGSISESIFNPGAKRIPDAMQIASVEIRYPSMDFNWGLFRLSWLWSFLIISMAFGFILKFIFKVE